MGVQNYRYVIRQAHLCIQTSNLGNASLFYTSSCIPVLNNELFPKLTKSRIELEYLKALISGKTNPYYVDTKGDGPK